MLIEVKPDTTRPLEENSNQTIVVVSYRKSHHTLFHNATMQPPYKHIHIHPSEKGKEKNEKKESTGTQIHPCKLTDQNE